MQRHSVPFLVIMVLILPAMSLAHGTHVHQTNTEAVCVEFLFDDHSPMAGAKFEVLGPEADLPFQEGRTDQLGRVVFRPDRAGSWLVKVWTGDGHGAQAKVDVTGEMLTAEPSGRDNSRMIKFIVGPLVIFVLFWGLSRIMRKR